METGTGYLGIRGHGQPKNNLDGDFGKEINYQFIAPVLLGNNEEIQVSWTSVYPNPATSRLSWNAVASKKGKFVFGWTAESKLVGPNIQRIELNLHWFDLTDFPAGPYFICSCRIKM